jgi:hypothetical protein
MYLGRWFGNHHGARKTHPEIVEKLCFLSIARPLICMNKMSAGWRRSSGGNTMASLSDR